MLSPRNILIGLVFVVALAACITVVAFYVGKFHGELSADQSTWGQFGDYVGGTLNPFLSFLSLIALLGLVKK
jgi:hypothetical protein